jgi:prepilin-type N-terminal cleavage/methylation domain-containing protein
MFKDKKTMPSRIAHAPRQRGFTLPELLIGIAIVALFATLIVSTFSGDSSKGAKLLSDMTTLKDALNRAKTDMGGIPNRFSVLWSRTDATAANMFNGVVATVTWSGPYVERESTDANNNITATAITDSATISIAREAASAVNGGNFTWVYYMRASNIPNPIIAESLKKCTGSTDAGTATFANGVCRATPGTGTTEIGTFDVKVADSR